MNSNNLDIIFLVNILDVDSWIQSKTEDDSSLMHRQISFDNECIIIVTENLNFIKNVNIRFYDDIWCLFCIIYNKSYYN